MERYNLDITHKRTSWLGLHTWKPVKIRAYEYGQPLSKEGEKMNKKASQKKKVVLLVLILCFTVFLSACDTTSQKVRYYSDRSNYVDATGTIDYIAYEDNYTILYLGFSELTPKFDDETFKIVGDNLSIVLEKGINQKILEFEEGYANLLKWLYDGKP